MKKRFLKTNFVTLAFLKYHRVATCSMLYEREEKILGNHVLTVFG